MLFQRNKGKKNLVLKKLTPQKERAEDEENVGWLICLEIHEHEVLAQKTPGSTKYIIFQTYVLCWVGALIRNFAV